MTLCIKHTEINYDNIIINDNKEYTQDNYSYKKRYILYKYDLNICKELLILTDFIDIDKITYTFNQIKILIKDINIINIVNFLQNKINQEQINEENTTVNFNFINNNSELILYPSKKSGLEKYVLNKNENYNIISRYFPYISNSNIFHQAKFLLKVICINNKFKFNIINGEIKYKTSYIDSKLKSVNVYESKINIDL